MKYFCFLMVATVFGVAGWLLRGELMQKDESAKSLEVSFPLKVKQGAMEFLEGVWSYEDSSAFFFIYEDVFALSLEENNGGAASGNYFVDSIKLIDSGVEVRIILTGLEYTDELLEKIEQDSANDPFRDGSTDNDFFNKNSLKGHFVITLNENGETFLQVTNQSWMAVPGKVAVKVSRR